MTAPPIRVRFAPSPTGHLHVGGARTALFNFLFARRHRGTFIVRIEDTDIQRNIEGAEKQLLDDLKWLGLNYDEGPDAGGDHGPYRQSQRRSHYDAAIEKLIDAGAAYYATETPEELDALRRRAEARKEVFRYRRPDPLPTKADADRARADGRPVVVRFKSPNEAITIHDEILGDVTFPAGELDDFVIAKSNGWPTYHLAVVVDDDAMRITHVLRAQEHLMNTPKHVFLQRALGVATPAFAHMPLVFNIDGTKMSKRDKHKAVRQAVRERLQGAWKSPDEAAAAAGCSTASIERWLKDKADAELDGGQLARLAGAVGAVVPEIDVYDFRRAGYLPEALRNFVALIGWSPGDDREKLPLDDMIEAFSLSRINKTAGRFDREKLLAMNTDYAASAAPDALLAGFRDWARVANSPLAALDDPTASRVLDACRGFRTFADVASKAGILFATDDAVTYDDQAVQKVLAKANGAGFEMLRRLRPRLADCESWTAATLDDPCAWRWPAAR
jgi:glutamyl-tRNA synthetase